MSFSRRWLRENSPNPIVRSLLVVGVLAILLLSSLGSISSALVAAGGAHPLGHIAPAQTYSTVTFTGNPATDFPSDALLYTNWFTPWGSANNITGLYGTWNQTYLFLGLSGINISGNQLLFTVSTNTTAGTTNLSNLGGEPAAHTWDRTIDFTQPVNFIFIVSGSGVLTSYEVLSAPGSAQTLLSNVTGALATDDSVALNSTSGNYQGGLEVALPLTTIYPSGFPTGATVGLYASVFGGSGGYAGPTIPSGQSYDVTYQGPIQLTSHDRAGGYLLENTFYQLDLDPNDLGMPEAGITPNYVENETFHSVSFTGDLATDFAPGELALTNPNTMWGSGNLLNSAYLTWNETTLFLGFNATIGSNYLYFFLGNDSGSGLGSYSLNYTNDSSLNRPYIFSQPINFVGDVHYSGTSVPGPVEFYGISTPVADSNTSTVVQNDSAKITALTTTTSIEVAIPFSVLYDRPGSWPIIGQFANVSLIAVVSGGGGPSTGPTLPAGQGYAYTGYYNQNHSVDGSDLLNTFFTENLDPYGDAVPALQINPTYTYGHTYHSVHFTGTPTRDFVAPEIIGVGTYTGWSSSNLLNASYLTWNFTTLFVGTNSTVGGGNDMMVAISNGTGVGATNFSSTNVPNLQRNFLFGTPVNFVLSYVGGDANASLYGVDLAGTTATHTDFTFLGNFTAGTTGEEFAIPFSELYPNQPAVAGTGAIIPGAHVSTVALIYGGPGAYIGPTIPTGQNFSSGTAYAPINAFDTVGLDPNKNGYAEPGIVPSTPALSFSGAPISLNIVFNDHQPLYEAIDGSLMLPWTVVHLEEYAEQALLAGLYPNVNITYSLSGSLLYQIDAIAHGGYDNAYLEAAEIPSSQWGNTVYTEVTTYGDTFLGSFVQPYQWNTTTVANLLEYNLAFNTPPWVYSAPTPASTTYATLFHDYQDDVTLSTAQLTNALVEFFLWSTSWPIITGQLGGAYINSTMWTLFNQTTFSISDLNTIAGYYPVEAQLVLSAFSHDRMLNDGSGGNVELITTPFDHPIVPLLLLNNWTDENGATITKGVWSNDTVAQLQIGSELYQQLFGQAPLGLWSPEQAVSASSVPYLSSAGYEWTSSSQATLGASGVSVPGSGAVTAQEMENLYTPYTVTNGSSSITMVFRDDTLSNDWGFNYGTVANESGNWAAVDQFMAYLKNVYATIPRSTHNQTLVTLALDGENWMFMSSFPEDGVPFLSDVYTALEQNSSWLHTTTVQQYLATSPTLPTISKLATGSWNDEPTGSGINGYLGQWAGHGLQDALWQQLTTVRAEVQSYGTAHGLTQPETLAQLEAANDFPYIDQWNSSAQAKYTEAWTGIYGAEGSDTYFALDPNDQSPTAQNAIVFEQIFRSDLSLALTSLGLPLTPFLESSYQVPLTPTTWGTNTSLTPTLDGSLYTTESFKGGTGYSIDHNSPWTGAYIDSTGDTTVGAAEIASTTYAFSVSNLYFSIAVNGATTSYKSPNFYTAAADQINIYFSPINPQPGDVQSLNVPDGAYTIGSVPFGFAATTEATIEGNSITPTGSATLGVFASSASGTWTSTTTVSGDAFVGTLLQLQVPMSDLGMVPGDSIEFFVATVNGTTGAPVSWSGPLYITVPSSLAKLTQISAIHNTAIDNGPGDYTYPTLTSSFPPGSFDMEWFNVSENPYTVQFNITFGNLSNVYNGNLGFSQPIIDIFIHEPGTTGSTAGYPGPDVDFATGSGWAWMIQASGYSSWNYVESSATMIENPAPVLVTTNLGEPGSNPTVEPNKNVSIQVPTSIIGNNIGSYSYVIVAGSQDGEGDLINGWRVVTPSASEYQGGGAVAADSPNVYSYIAPAMVGSNPVLTQQDLLANYSATQNATLVAIHLPLITPVSTSTATLGPSAIVNASGDPDAYYAFGSQLYASSSTGGEVWSAPTPLVNLSFVPTGLAGVGGNLPGLLAWNGSKYDFVNLTSDVVTSGSEGGAIVAGAVTFTNGTFLLALDVSGANVYILPPNAAPWGYDTLNALAVGFSSSNGTTYLAYATSTTISVLAIGIKAGAATFGSTSVLNATLPTGSTPDALALAAAPDHALAIAVADTNASGENIYFVNGTGKVNLTTVTTDGYDSSPSVLIGTTATGGFDAYVGFTNSANGGNVFFLPAPEGNVTPAKTTSTTPPPPPPPAKSTSSSSGTPEWVWIVIAVVVVAAVIGAVLAISRMRKRGGGGNEGSSTESGTESSGPGSGGS